MRSHLTVVFILVLAIGWTWLFSMARYDFSGVDAAKEQVVKVEKKLKQEKLKTAMIEAQFLEYQGVVASLLPESIPQNEKSYPLRRLASVSKTKDHLSLKVMTANNLLAQGKVYFRSGEYSKASQKFKKIIRFYSYSDHVVEAYFLHAESLYQMALFEESVVVIQKMIELFPSSELTGFAMLRLGKVLEVENRSTEALEVYQTIVQTFPQRDLASQAIRAAKDLEF